MGSLRFIYSRIARVWPAHIVVMLLFYLLFRGVFEIAYAPTIGETFLGTTLLQAWSPLPSDFFAFNSVTWTLSVEMFFYLLFPVLIADFSRTWHVKLVASGSLAFYAIYIATKTGVHSFSGANLPSIASWVYIWPPAHLIEFVLGMTAGFAWKTFGYWLDNARAASAAQIGGVLLILAGSAKIPGMGWQLESMGHISEATRTWISVSGAAPCYAAALWLLAGQRGIVSRALSYRPLVWLGEISFSMYLVHQPIERALQLHPQWFAAYPIEIQFVGYWLATIGASWVLWRSVEKPAQAAMMRLINKGNAASKVPPAATPA
nr:hypothetical protein HUO10_003605 [Paraburkholderia busanensis]